MEKVDIRKLQLSDYPGVSRVDELTQKQYRGLAWEDLAEAEKELCLTSRATEFELNVETGYGYVAVKAEEIVGFVLAHETLPYRGTVFIRHIAIDPAYQGQGIGPRLYEAVIKQAKKNGITRITSLINPDNSPSLKLHQQVGFELRDRQEAVLWLD